MAGGGVGQMSVKVTFRIQVRRSKSSDRCRCPSSPLHGTCRRRAPARCGCCAAIGLRCEARRRCTRSSCGDRSVHSAILPISAVDPAVPSRPLDGRCAFARCRPSLRHQLDAKKKLGAPDVRRAHASREAARASRSEAKPTSRNFSRDGFPPALDHLCKQSSRPRARDASTSAACHK